ncbi:MAG: hypothetical protein F6K48_31640 [Okeania sp. SIO3H1]|nr:hypothetical protein [Okeania sp. SIO3H1]
MLNLNFQRGILYQIDKCLLQISRVFLRSQPTPAPPRRGSQESGVRMNSLNTSF